jgi:transposase
MPDRSNDPLRFLTRYRYRLAHQLGTLKVQALTWLYLKDSAYGLLEPFKNPFSQTSRSILRQYPDLDDLLAVPLEELADQLQTFARGALHDALENARRLQAVAQHSYPIPDELRENLHRILACQFDLITAFEKQIKGVDRTITQVVAEDADIANLRSLGGLGPVFSAGLAAELRPTERFFQNQHYNPDTGAWHSPTWADAQAAVGKLAGLWWPASDSGKFASEERHMPMACNPYLRYYLFEAANHVRERVAEFGAFYQRKKAESVKHAHHRALVLTARKLARVVFALLHKHQSYQPRKVV